MSERGFSYLRVRLGVALLVARVAVGIDSHDGVLAVSLARLGVEAQAVDVLAVLLLLADVLLVA
jgi:hypothetical protein